MVEAGVVSLPPATSAAAVEGSASQPEQAVTPARVPVEPLVARASATPASVSAPAPAPVQYAAPLEAAPEPAEAPLVAATSPAVQESNPVPEVLPTAKVEGSGRKKTPAPARRTMAPAKKAEAASANLIQKKSPRRGIRLKNHTDEGSGQD